MLKNGRHFSVAFFLILLLTVSLSSQVVTKKEKKPEELSPLEISVQLGYAHPMLEAYGENMTINAAEDQIFIDGKRLLVSDNLGAENGFSVQTYLKYNFMKKGYVKGLFNVGYNNLFSVHPGPSDFDIGIRVQSFSLGLGTEVNPIGHEKPVYPGIYGLMRMNLIGGETFHRSGLDFFKVTPRYGYSAGLKVNFSFKKTLGMYAGYSYNYDNLWGRQPDENTPNDAHVIVFRDEASPTNGLAHDRRIAYWSLHLGMNFFFK
jgi:hypothetical protein